MIDLFNQSIENDRFNLNEVYNDIYLEAFLPQEPYKTIVGNIEDVLGAANLKMVIKSLIRYAFYIEPVKKPKIETTKFAVRWTEELNGDPRQSTFDECLATFLGLLNSLNTGIQTQANKELIELMVNNTMIPYEIPIDYIASNTPRIHLSDNISWQWGDLPLTVVNLRKYLTDSTKHDYAAFFRGVYNKVKTKTYLTDRVLTGTHKTNREKRWECHPDSVHFALRRVSWEIELKLIRLVCHFDGFPTDLKTLMEAASIIQFDDETAKCPITFEPLSFINFRNEIENTTHGKSNFQVGHMNPLKSDDTGNGHNAENISWISEQGNRIQGSNSVAFIREFIAKIYKNYVEAGIIENPD